MYGHSHYFPTASLKATPELSSSQFEREKQEKNYKPKSAFRLWGYKSSADTESIEQIAQGSNRFRTEAAHMDGMTPSESEQLE